MTGDLPASRFNHFRIVCLYSRRNHYTSRTDHLAEGVSQNLRAHEISLSVTGENLRSEPLTTYHQDLSNFCNFRSSQVHRCRQSGYGGSCPNATGGRAEFVLVSILLTATSGRRAFRIGDRSIQEHRSPLRFKFSAASKKVQRRGGRQATSLLAPSACADL